MCLRRLRLHAATASTKTQGVYVPSSILLAEPTRVSWVMHDGPAMGVVL